IGRTRGTRPGAGLGQVAHASGTTAFRAARNERVRRTIIAHAIAGLRHVADSCGATTFSGALRVGWTGRAGTRAGFRKVTYTGSTTALGSRRNKRVRWAIVAR